jgi:uncharacterized protein YggE
MNTFFDKRTQNLITAVLALFCLFLFVESIGALADIHIKNESTPAANIITASGTGEAVATPDIATFSFTVREDNKDVSVAQQSLSTKANLAIAFLKKNGIADKDIQTSDYSANPKYDYQGGVCTGGICTPSKQVLTGYEVSETVVVKVRDVSKAGTLLTGIAGLSIGEVSNLSFTVDDMDTLKAKAQADAIEKAQADAKTIAKSLGVSLGKVTGYYENAPDNSYPVSSGAPTMMVKAMDSAVAPDLQSGQQKVTVTVSVTYEIR